MGRGIYSRQEEGNYLRHKDGRIGEKTISER